MKYALEYTWPNRIIEGVTFISVRAITTNSSASEMQDIRQPLVK